MAMGFKVELGVKQTIDGRMCRTVESIPKATHQQGVWGKEGLSLIKKIGSKITRVTGEKRSTNYLFQHLSICLQRSNAACDLGTLPPGKRLDEISFL